MTILITSLFFEQMCDEKSQKNAIFGKIYKLTLQTVLFYFVQKMTDFWTYYSLKDVHICKGSWHFLNIIAFTVMDFQDQGYKIRKIFA